MSHDGMAVIKFAKRCIMFYCVINLTYTTINGLVEGLYGFINR